jgi:hypothetical protein
VYPPQDILEEVGRITIAGARLDRELGLLWSHLDREKDPVKARQYPDASKISKLAEERLTGALWEAVASVLRDEGIVRHHRNAVVHQDWILRGRDAMHPVAEISKVEEEDMPAYADAWAREAMPSDDWLMVPHSSLDLLPAQQLEELEQVERELRAVTDRLQELVFKVASARDVDKAF